MAAFIELDAYRVETHDAGNGLSLRCKLKFVRKADGAFFILGTGDGWMAELLWLHAHGDKGLNDLAQAVIEIVGRDGPDDEMWERPSAPGQQAPLLAV